MYERLVVCSRTVEVRLSHDLCFCKCLRTTKRRLRELEGRLVLLERLPGLNDDRFQKCQIHRRNRLISGNAVPFLNKQSSNQIHRVVLDVHGSPRFDRTCGCDSRKQIASLCLYNGDILDPWILMPKAPGAERSHWEN